MSEAPPPEVLPSEVGRLRRLTLNRPKALNALTLSMCRAMTDTLLRWRDDENASLVVIDHAGERGFCAGGDIRALAESAAADGSLIRDFLFTEYRLDHLISVFPKPVVAIMDGVTMGGGVGISLPARYRVVTERTVFAMPETSIGLFPDVGSGWWLPRLPGQTGLWLGLTGARIRARDCVELGLATHFVPSERTAELKEALAKAPEAVEQTLVAFSSPAPGESEISDRAALDELFAASTLEGVFERLASATGRFASSTLAVLQAKSPQAMKVAFRQIRLGADRENLAQALRTEFRLGVRMMLRPDFTEGVRSVLIDKDNAPRWSPPTIEAVSETMLDEVFAPLPPEDEWTPLN